MPEQAHRISGFADLATPDAEDGEMDPRICYWKDDQGTWLLYLPGCGLGSLKGHTVEEHEDGTITASPSVLMTAGKKTRHGFLRRGMWEEC